MKRLILLFIFLALIFMICCHYEDSVIPTIAKDNIEDILNNSKYFKEVLKQELSKKYPNFIVDEVINQEKIYKLDSTDLEVTIYSHLLNDYIKVAIDCNYLLGLNIACISDGNKKDNNFSLDPTKPTVALTFDDGPSKYTREVGDILNENKANATFFILANKITESNSLDLKYLLKMGNEIGTHTYSHKILTRLAKSKIDSEINGSKDIINKYLNYDVKLLRPPYGITNTYIKNNFNLSIILWDIDTLDWQSRSAKKVYQKIINHVQDGDIILMHETYASSVEALKMILPVLYQKGYQVTSVSNLAKLKNISLESNKIYHNFK
jgi:peptidoglycan/xylan/chitin deacetylase (PgdA/CDA1 family)